MKKLSKQPTKLDFDSAVEAWERKEITRDQLAEHLKELGFNDPEFIIEDLIIDLECEERRKVRERIEKAFERGDMEETLNSAHEILSKFGQCKGW